MADPLIPIITDAGIAAAFAADALGEHVSIASVGLGDTGWTPDATATALMSEQATADVAGGSNPAPNQVHLAALFDGPEEFWIREIGFYLADSTLFAIWSHDSDTIGYKSALADFLLSLDLVMSVIPPGSVTIETTEDALSVGNAADIAAVVARVDIIEPRVDPARVPILPNLMPDTKKFVGLCGGALNTPLAWDSGGLGGDWGGYWEGSADGTLSVEVVDATDETRLTALGLWPLGVLNDELDSGLSTDYHIVVLDFDLTTLGGTYKAAPIDAWLKFTILHADSLYASFFTGRFASYTSAFVNVLQCDADLQFQLMDDRYAGVTIGPSDEGQGWQFLHNLRTDPGVGGNLATRVYAAAEASTGRVHLALALPYVSFGDHEGVPVWAGYIGDYMTNDLV